MAATLLQIKSRLLLPKQPKLADDEEDPQEVLVRQLVEYKKMKALSQAMGGLWDARSLMMGRQPAPPMPYEHALKGISTPRPFTTPFNRCVRPCRNRKP